MQLDRHLMIVASFMLCLYCVRSIDIIQCGSYWTYENVTIENCGEEDTSCRLKIGANTSISFVINTGKNDNGAIDIGGVVVNDVAFFPIGNLNFSLAVTPDDPCDILKCPFETNYEAPFSAQIYVYPEYPQLSARLKWIMKTEKDDQLLCFSFPITLV